MPPRIKTINELKHELAMRERSLNELRAQRDKLDQQIARLTGEAVTVSVAAQAPLRGGRRGVRKFRGPGGKPLTAYIAEVLKAATGKGMRAKDIATEVKQAGYPTSSKAFYGIVAATLRDKKKFKKLGRGVYTLPG